MILVDTSVWVASLRRAGARERAELNMLLSIDEVATTDIVVAEVLQGAQSTEDFEDLMSKLDAPHFFHADRTTWLRATQLSFDLRRRGQTTALSDLLIATVALENDLEVYALDSDFARVPQLKLHEARSA